MWTGKAEAVERKMKVLLKEFPILLNMAWDPLPHFKM